MFAPVYRPRGHQQTFWTRQQKDQSEKRKRDEISGDDEDDAQSSNESDPIPRTATTSVHPVNRKDPYHIAGHPREEPLPLSPFPHAAVKESKLAHRPIEEELADLNPPLYVPRVAPEDRTTSLKRRHLDNLTTILHKCMLKGDWERAYRAWCLLIRSEVAGRGVDVRRNGRWGIGAELLMRKGASNATHDDGVIDDDRPDEDTVDDSALTSFSAEGFKLARDYYQRFVVQYPYTRSTLHGFNATAIYPAVFSVWIFEVQHLSSRAQRKLDSSNTELEENDSIEADSKLSLIKLSELERALPIADRMDELLLSPPYDTDKELRRLRSHVARWIVDLFDEIVALRAESEDQDHGNHFARFLKEREKAETLQEETTNSRLSI